MLEVAMFCLCHSMFFLNHLIAIYNELFKKIHFCIGNYIFRKYDLIKKIKGGYKRTFFAELWQARFYLLRQAAAAQYIYAAEPYSPIAPV